MKSGIIKRTVFLYCSLMSLMPACAVTANASLNRDRWMEVDLFCFERENMKVSSDRFWERMAPLFKDIDGDYGVMFNIGWLMDFILEWSGDLSAAVPLPEKMTIWPQFSDEGFLLGSTDRRKEIFKKRFEGARGEEVVTYEKWSYKDLKAFLVIFRRSAREHGLNRLKVGTLVLGVPSAYQGNSSKFVERHPESFRGGCFNPIYRMTDDNSHYGAYPNGVSTGLPVTEFFGNQWGDLSKKTGFDAIVLRDFCLGQGVYQRKGPYGFSFPNDPVLLNQWSSAYADLVRFVKKANPAALVIGYSSAASAVADWRINAVDLESIAMEGYLDAYIDQSWAGAWNEVAQRPGTGSFWNLPHLGWSYQLAYILVHAAVLSETPCKHYILTETFDGWESWNIINTARERLRWGIWAYSHAGVKKPGGVLKFPDGSYISWANQARRLLSREDVEFITRESNAAFADLDHVKEIHGPTLVYCRNAMARQNADDPSQHIKEWIDEQAGTLMKWSVPILSIARVEHIDKISSDMLIIQTPVHLSESEKAAVEAVIDAGRPVVVVGSPAGGIDPHILARAGLSTNDTLGERIEYCGSFKGVTSPLTEGCENLFVVCQPFTMNRVDHPETEIIYWVSNSPALVKNKNLIIWDAPELMINLKPTRGWISTDEMIGSPVPYVALARLIERELKEYGAFSATFQRINNPVWCGSWSCKEGNLHILAGEIEEGIDHTDRGFSDLIVTYPQAMEKRRQMITQRWSGTRYISAGNGFKFTLRKGESMLFHVRPISDL